MNYRLKFDNCIGDYWVDLNIKGDPGRTTIKQNATIYETENLARENKAMLEAIYRRKLKIDPVV